MAFFFLVHFELPNKFLNLKNKKLFLETENKRKKQLLNPHTKKNKNKNKKTKNGYNLHLKDTTYIFYSFPYNFFSQDSDALMQTQ